VPACLAAHPEKIEERKLVLLGIDSKVFHAACTILQKAALTPLWRHLKVPTLVVCREFYRANPAARTAGRLRKCDQEFYSL